MRASTMEMKLKLSSKFKVTLLRGAHFRRQLHLKIFETTTLRTSTD